MKLDYTIHSIGRYCGRYAEGFLGEPQNSLSNLAFVIGAVYVWTVWRKSENKNPFAPVLFVMVASIGVGSFIFHTFPSKTTLWIDLIPIQIFALTYFGFVGVKYFGASLFKVGIALVVFFYARQYWIVFMPRGALGGGITHIPTLLLLLGCGALLYSRHKQFSIKLLSAGLVYALALFIRTWDLYFCAAFPLGLHWVWHLLTALAASILIFAAATFKDARQE